MRKMTSELEKHEINLNNISICACCKEPLVSGEYFTCFKCGGNHCFYCDYPGMNLNSKFLCYKCDFHIESIEIKRLLNPSLYPYLSLEDPSGIFSLIGLFGFNAVFYELTNLDSGHRTKILSLLSQNS